MDPNLARAEIEQVGHVSLPASSSKLEAHVERGADSAVWARFELPATDLAPFLSAAGYTELSDRDRAVENWHMPTKVAWWTPDAITPFLAGRLRREAQKPRYAGHVLASAEGKQRTVYLFVTGL